MSVFDSLRAGLLELPISDILKARLDFALEQAAALERQVAALQAENAELKVQLGLARSERDDLREQFQRLKEEHSEEVRIHRGIEFRRGIRTGGKWLAFCPLCHTPALDYSSIRCPDEKTCGWFTLESGVEKIAGEIE